MVTEVPLCIYPPSSLKLQRVRTPSIHSSLIPQVFPGLPGHILTRKRDFQAPKGPGRHQKVPEDQIRIAAITFQKQGSRPHGGSCWLPTSQWFWSCLKRHGRDSPKSTQRVTQLSTESFFLGVHRARTSSPAFPKSIFRL